MTPIAIATGHPLERAACVLHGRFANLGRRGLRLDGRLVSPQQLVVAANEVLAAAGYPLIAYPGIAEVQRRGKR